jgi:chromosome partitioning protein
MLNRAFNFKRSWMMAARIITIAQQKGGAGKTTLAAHLAIAWAAMSKNVAVIDIDPQASLATWFAMRGKRLGDKPSTPGMSALDHYAIAGWRVAGKATELARDHDIVLIDSPPHADTEARFAISAADLVLVPVQPSPMDVWASEATVALARAEKTPALIVFNRVPTRAKLTDIMVTAIKELGTPMAEARIGNRVALAASIAEGLGITETEPRSRAASEINALAREVLLASP